LRNNSKFHGLPYGKQVFKENRKCDFSVICILNKHAGQLSFIIDGIQYGIAFENEIIKNKPMYFAMSCALGAKIEIEDIPYEEENIFDN